MLPAFPAIRADLGLPEGSTEVTRIITTYFLGLAAGTLVYGPLSDRFGRKPLLFTEIGWTSVNGANMQWSNTVANPGLDLQEQADLYGAFLDSLGWVYFKLGQYTEASQNLQKAVERSSTDPTVHDHLGQVYEKTGKLKLAVTQWDRSMAEYSHSLPADADPIDVAKVQHHLDAAKIKLAKVSTPASK